MAGGNPDPDRDQYRDGADHEPGHLGRITPDGGGWARQC